MPKQNSISKHTIIENLHLLCSGSIINYKKQYWLQKMGIPQGLNVSGVLCSLYFGTLETQYVKVKDGVLMRLTDDYIYLGDL
jgi:telomerase reverse transcriptase